MSLPEAVLAIADRMKIEAVKEFPKGKDGVATKAMFLEIRMQSFADELATAIKAAEGNAQPQQQWHPSQLLTPQMQNVLEIEKAREEMRKAKGSPQSPIITKDKADIEERHAGEFRELVGGPMAGDDVEATYVPVDPQDPPPVGAKSEFNGVVYVMEADLKFHYSEEETKKFQERRNPQQTSKIVLG